MHEKEVIPFGYNQGKALEDVPLRELDRLLSWMQERPTFRTDFRLKLTAYLNQPSIQREIEREIEEGKWS